MKAFVANPARRKAKKKQQKREKRNPLPLVVMNPFQRRNKMAKARKKNKGGAGHRSRSRMFAKNPIHHRRRRHNPFPETGANAAKLVFSAALALLGSTYIPGWLLSFFGVADSGLVSYFLAAVVAFGPAFALQAYPQFAKGWLAGGGAAFVWRIIDDLTGGKYVTITPGPGMGSFIINGQTYVLPAASVFAPYARGQRGSQALLTAGPAAGGAAAGASPMAVAGAAAPGGMGWVYQS